VSAPPRDARAGDDDAPWWPASTAKFAIMTFGTLGLYHYYWIYYNWQRLRGRESAPLSPVWRTLFAPFTIYRMFARAHESAREAQVRAPWNPIGLAAVYFVANIALLIGIPTWLMGPVLLLPVLPAQMTMAAVNAKVAPEAPRNDRITATNWAFLVLGLVTTAFLYAMSNVVDQLLKEWTP